MDHSSRDIPRNGPEHCSDVDKPYTDTPRAAWKINSKRPVGDIIRFANIESKKTRHCCRREPYHRRRPEIVFGPHRFFCQSRPRLYLAVCKSNNITWFWCRESVIVNTASQGWTGSERDESFPPPLDRPIVCRFPKMMVTRRALCNLKPMVMEVFPMWAPTRVGCGA